jgi:hypothetical protein
MNSIQIGNGDVDNAQALIDKLIAAGTAYPIKVIFKSRREIRPLLVTGNRTHVFLKPGETGELTYKRPSDLYETLQNLAFMASVQGDDPIAIASVEVAAVVQPVAQAATQQAPVQPVAQAVPVSVKEVTAPAAAGDAQ